MNQNNITSNNDNNVGTYKASGNLNTVISNPSANINNTMNVNIQSMPTENVPNASLEQNLQTNNIPPEQNSQVSVAENQNISQTQPVEQSSTNETVTKTYVSNDNKASKKTISLNMGPEFKLALLIIILLLVFILVLPLVPRLF